MQGEGLAAFRIFAFGGGDGKDLGPVVAKLEKNNVEIPFRTSLYQAPKDPQVRNMTSFLQQWDSALEQFGAATSRAETAQASDQPGPSAPSGQKRERASDAQTLAVRMQVGWSSWHGQ